MDDSRSAKFVGDDHQLLLFVPFGTLPPQSLHEIMENGRVVVRDGKRGALVAMDSVVSSSYRSELDLIARMIRVGDLRVEPEHATADALRALAEAEGKSPLQRIEEARAIERAVNAVVETAGLEHGSDRAHVMAREAVRHVYFGAAIPDVRAEVLLDLAGRGKEAQVGEVRILLAQEMGFYVGESGSPRHVRLAAGAALVLLLVLTTDRARVQRTYALDHPLSLPDLDLRVRQALRKYEHGVLGRPDAVAITDALLAEAEARQLGAAEPAAADLRPAKGAPDAMVGSAEKDTAPANREATLAKPLNEERVALPLRQFSRNTVRVWEYIKDKPARPTWDEITHVLHMGRSTVSEAFKELRAAGWLPSRDKD